MTEELHQDPPPLRSTFSGNVLERALLHGRTHRCTMYSPQRVTIPRRAVTYERSHDILLPSPFLCTKCSKWLKFRSSWNILVEMVQNYWDSFSRWRRQLTKYSSCNSLFVCRGLSEADLTDRQTRRQGKLWSRRGGEGEGETEHCGTSQLAFGQV